MEEHPRQRKKSTSIKKKKLAWCLIARDQSEQERMVRDDVREIMGDKITQNF